ncbi:hypothetical protein MaudCBS49596_007131 [Microsporum audouinii]
MWNPVLCLACCIVILQNIQVSAWSIPRGYLGVHTSLKGHTIRGPVTKEASKHGASPVPPSWFTVTTDNVAEEGVDDDAIENKMSDQVTLKRLMADLETCIEDLLPYSTERAPNDLVQISGSKVRSCRQAIYSLIRWFRSSSTNKPTSQNKRRDDQKSRFNLVKPGDNTDPRQTGRLGATGDLGRSRPTQTVTRPPTCRDQACSPGDLTSTCVTKGGAKLKPTLAQMCNMCFPRRNERLIDEYCSERAQKEWHIFYILFAILVAISGAGITLAAFRKIREKGQKSRETGSDVLPTKRFIQPTATLGNPSLAKPKSRRVGSWLAAAAAYLRNQGTRVDIEEHAALDARVTSLSPPTLLPNQVDPNRQQTFQVSGAEACERQAGLKLRKSCDSSLEVPGKAAIPRARSSSVQAIPNGSGEPQRLSVDMGIHRPHTAQ